MKSFITSLVAVVTLSLSMAYAQSIHETKITASDATGNQWFGESVSISGEYVIVGAYGKENGTDSGSAYIFKRDGTSWPEQARLTASDGAAWDTFGKSSSISGNYAILGAEGDDDNGSDSGSAYIFKRDSAGWTEQARLTAGDGDADDAFGHAVSISGDYAVVGAHFDEDEGRYAGSAYIFKRDGTSWTEQAKLTASDAADTSFFGNRVAISGDYVIIGVPELKPRSGSAYIFKRDSASCTEQAKLTASDAGEGDGFGWSVSISNDYAIVGSVNDDDDDGLYSGSAYIFKRDGTNWTEQAKLTPSDGGERDWFGYSIAISGDYAIVGSRIKDNEVGGAYIFRRDGTKWTEQFKLKSPIQDQFGYSVAISGEYAIVGAVWDNEFGEASGAAYLYSGFSLPTTVEDNISSIPTNFVLEQNYPNPFNPETEIRFQLPKPGNVVLRIFNILGEEIITLINKPYVAGHHTARWDGKDNNGKAVSSGIYIYQLQAGEFSQVKKMSLLR